MPNGFAGRPAIRYIGDAAVEHQAADNAVRQARNITGRSVTVRPLPHRPEDARTGSSTSGRGNSSNIVANRDEYARVANLVRNADNRMASSLQNVAQQIEAMCQTAFVLPQASPLCNDLSGTLRGSLGNFTGLTSEMLAQVQSYASDITNIS